MIFVLLSTAVVRWLSLGMLINILARPAFTLLQSSGRPDLVAKTHAVEFVPYIISLLFFTRLFGISGTAAIWSLRVLADNIILNVICAKRAIPGF
jgi:O-antigen/teichoic acid export membrane protein